MSSLNEVNCNTLFGTANIEAVYRVKIVLLLFNFSLYAIIVKSSHKKATISILSGGLNKTIVVACKVVPWIRHDDDAPL